MSSRWFANTRTGRNRPPSWESYQTGPVEIGAGPALKKHESRRQRSRRGYRVDENAALHHLVAALLYLLDNGYTEGNYSLCPAATEMRPPGFV